jgi:hypothetical protein
MKKTPKKTQGKPQKKSQKARLALLNKELLKAEKAFVNGSKGGLMTHCACAHTDPI